MNDATLFSQELAERTRLMDYQHHKAIKNLREEYEQRFHSNKEKATQYKKLTDLISKGDAIKNESITNEIEEELVQFDIQIAELYQILGFKKSV